ncbi:MAG: periplasmic heavy metal sensor [Candidatus Omnitrophica bacterium]|nr:periplasmic heavy metal sensor [Candidatus Omnitrophota bacterium]
MRIAGKILFIGLLLTGFALRGYAAASGNEKGDKEGFREQHEKMTDEMTKDLGLSDEQVRKIKDLRKANMEKNKDIRAKMTAKKEDMAAELNKTESDQAKIDEIVGDITELYRQKTRERVEDVQEMKKVLTPEQFGLLNKRMKEKREEFRKKMKWGQEAQEE